MTLLFYKRLTFYIFKSSATPHEIQGGDVSVAKAKEVLETIALKDDDNGIIAKLALGQLLIIGGDGVTKDLAQARRYLVAVPKSGKFAALGAVSLLKQLDETISQVISSWYQRCQHTDCRAPLIVSFFIPCRCAPSSTLKWSCTASAT